MAQAPRSLSSRSTSSHLNILSPEVAWFSAAAPTVSAMSEENWMDWPTIKARYPELYERLKAGDLNARVEFLRLSFNAEIISERPHNQNSSKKR